MELINELFNEKVLNLRDFKGKTPLYWAVWINKVNLVEKLLELGASPNIYDFRFFKKFIEL